MIGILLLLSIVSFQQRTVFRVDVDAVQLDVFVAKDGKALRDLTVEDFEILDNGVRQDIRLIEPETVPLSTVLVFDTSDSVRGEKLQYLKAAARAFLKGLDTKDQAALLTFSSCLQLEGGLDGDVTTLADGLAFDRSFWDDVIVRRPLRRLEAHRRRREAPSSTVHGWQGHFQLADRCGVARAHSGIQRGGLCHHYLPAFRG